MPHQPYFSPAALADIAANLESSQRRARHIQTEFLGHTFSNDAAAQFAIYGVARRVDTLARCIAGTFQRIPPEQVTEPAKDDRDDVVIYLQAFIFNTFGVLDNLAHMWVAEKNIKKPNGTDIPNGRIGITPDKEDVFNSLPSTLQAEIIGLDRWLRHIEDFRHSLAHRIPFYIPPFSIDPTQSARYNELDELIRLAARSRDNSRLQSLRREQDAMKRFVPFMRYSLLNTSNTVAFHQQMLADLLTIETLCLSFRTAM